MPLYNSYQVQEQDKDLLTLAARLGVDYQTVKLANPSITSISQGQFINLPAGGPPPPPKVPAGPPRPPAASALQYSQPAGPPAIGSAPYAPGNGSNTYSGPNAPYIPGYGFTPSQPWEPTTTSTNSFLGGGGAVANTGQKERVFYNVFRLKNATDPSQLPGSIPATDLTAMGITPSKMLEAGYKLEGGNWILPGRGTAKPAAGAAVGHQSANNWETNDALHMITYNRYGKNRKSRFVTNLKWAKNAWKRRKLAAKGHRGGVSGIEPGMPEVRTDAPSTTLDLILGS